MAARGELARRAVDLESSRTPFVRATVVGVEPPTSAKPGDTALVLADGTIEGFVGGACAESTVRSQALTALSAGEPRMVRISPEPTDDHGGPGTDRVTVVNPCLSGGTLDVFLEPQLPPPLVLVVGDGPIARAVERVGRAAGHEVWLRGEPGGAIPPDAAAVVVATHGRGDEPALTEALQSGVPYVGLVASRRRGAAVLDSLGLGGDGRRRVHTPAGLDVGARTPGEVALAILAEIVALRPEVPTGSGVPAPATAPAGAVGTATDPVCGMAVAMVPASLHAEVAGSVYWFCGPGCRDAFLDDPGRYGG